MTVNAKLYVDINSFHQLGDRNLGKESSGFVDGSSDTQHTAKYLNLRSLDNGSYVLSVSDQKQNCIEVTHKLKILIGNNPLPLTIAVPDETRKAAWDIKKYTDFVKGKDDGKEHSNTLTGDIGVIKRVLENMHVKVEKMCENHRLQHIKQIFQQLPITLQVQSSFPVEVYKTTRSKDQWSKEDSAATDAVTKYTLAEESSKSIIADDKVEFLQERHASAFHQVTTFSYLFVTPHYFPNKEAPRFFSCEDRFRSLGISIGIIAGTIFVFLATIFSTLMCKPIAQKYASTCDKILDTAATILLVPVLGAIGCVKGVLGAVIHPAIAIRN